MKGIITQKGFSLVEIIVVMILVGIVAAVAGIGYVQVVKGMVFTKMNAVTVQKGQITIAKLVKEFSNINISSITAIPANPPDVFNSITFTTVKNGIISPNTTVTISGSTITYGGDVLTDQVSAFTLNYYDNYDSTSVTQPTGFGTWQSSRRIIEITLTLTGADGVPSVFTARVKPRNL